MMQPINGKISGLIQKPMNNLIKNLSEGSRLQTQINGRYDSVHISAEALEKLDSEEENESKEPKEITVTHIEKPDVTCSIKAMNEARRSAGNCFSDLVFGVMGGAEQWVEDIKNGESKFQEAVTLVTLTYGKFIEDQDSETPTFTQHFTPEQYERKLEKSMDIMLEYLKENSASFSELYEFHFGEEE